MSDDRDHRDGRFEVLIAGGGVAGLEAAFALQQLAGERVRVRVISRRDEFVYRPLAIGEPFNRSHAPRHPLRALVERAGAELINDALEHVDVPQRRVHLASGAQLPYHALLVATGASKKFIYEHASNLDDAHIDDLLHGLVQDIEEGYVRRLAVVIPAPLPWPLPAYEAALMASERAWDMQVELDVVLATPERAPLDVFGAVASRGVAALLHERRIEVITSCTCEVPGAQAVLVHPAGLELQADRIIALPALTGPSLSGLPHDGGGFVPVDEYGHVRGVDRVWAAGDCTDEPLKHGGIAAGLADIAAESIATMAGAHLHGRTFIPIIEGILMTGGARRYLRARPAWPGANGESVFETLPPSSRPPKIHARYLGPQLESDVVYR
ncbi:MAG TPA: FAD-dependent oxidoreductase [Solirubrobacteraceae bacterium]|nr:FAD-dependent oxidoreductase [Solirubrobacteraceae bacterium]